MKVNSWSRRLVAAGALLVATDATAFGAILINEFQYDDSGTDDREFVELYNNGAAAVDISGWVLAARDPTAANANFTPAGGIPAGTTLAPGAYYVVGHSLVSPSPNLVVPNATALENDNETLELRDASGALIDALRYEANKGTAFAVDVNGQVGANGGVWGNNNSIDGFVSSIGRFQDGLDSNVNGRDFGLLPATPGASNNLPLNANYVIPDVDGLSLPVGTVVPGYLGAFSNPKAINPTLADTNNPNAIPPSPHGGNVTVAWDITGGGNTAIGRELADEFLMHAYLDTRLFGEAGGEQTYFGIGTTDGFANFGDPSGAFLPGVGVTANGNTGIGWFYEKEDSAQLAKLHLIDFGPGGDSDNGGTWSIITTINLFGTQSDWHLLGIDYDSATGAVKAQYDNQVFNFNTVTGMLGTFYVGYRESLASVPLAKLRPATFDVIPEPSSLALAIAACCGLAVRRKPNA